MSTRRNQIKNMTLAAMLLAIAYIIPTLTQSIPSFNVWFSPMHLPIILAGFVVGWKYGVLVGFLAPILRAYTIGLPYPVAAWPMAFELATYGLICGLLYQLLPKKIPYLFINLILSMLIGRAINILAKLIILPLFGQAFVLLGAIDAIVTTWPSFILNLILVPLILVALARANLIKGFKQ